MIKRFTQFTAITLLLAMLLYVVQQFFIGRSGNEISYELWGVYLFLIISYVLIVLGVEFLSRKMPNQVGFFYLASVFVKIGFFILTFSNVLFAEVELTLPERIHLIVPFMLFLIVEAVYSGKLMNMVS